MRVRARGFVALLAASMLLAGACKSGTTAGNESPGTSKVGGSLEVAAVWTGPEQANFKRVIAAFEAESGAKVTFTSSGDDIGAFLGPRLEGGKPPDVAMLPQPGLLTDLASQGVLKDIEALVGDQIDQHFPADFRALGTVDGKLLGLFWKSSNKSTFWYNIHAFEDAGVGAPATFDELLTNADTIKASGVTPFSLGADVGWPLTDWFENIYLRTAGKDMYDQLAKHEIPWTDQSVKDALAVFARVLDKPDNIVGGLSGAAATDNNTAATQIAGNPPKAAMYYEGDFVGGIIAGTTDSKVGTDVDFFPFPSIDGSPPSVVTGGDAAVLLTDNKAAQEFIKFLATPDAAAQWVPQGGFTSPIKDFDTSLYPDEVAARAAEELVSAETLRYDLGDQQPAEFGATTGKGFWGLLIQFLKNPSDIDGITKKLEAAAAKAYAG